MVFYNPPKRQPRKAADGKITDLPDELLLNVLNYLGPNDTQKFRATCRAFAPIGSTAIAQRYKILYISPMRSSLLAAVEICAHPIFSSIIEEVVVLGSEPQREQSKWYREFGDYLLTWPTTFPTVGKTVVSKNESPSSGGFLDIYKPLLDALSALPRLKKLSFASAVSRTCHGLNQVKRDSLISFPRRHNGKPSADHERWSDGYAMFAILASLGPQIEDFCFSESLADSYEDLKDAEIDFALSVVKKKALDGDEEGEARPTNLQYRVQGSYFGRPEGRYFMPRNTFMVGETSAIAGIRRHSSRRGALEMQYTHKSKAASVNLWML
ncbi:uncharacterized protein RCC_01851 [Ramularia collo-cygni]|uniref:F-box domain-containing protein n=1 Tax=Ramularia collo-cygni TaxID=112498 RepID=A0A2D3UN25_9PEZI|nr:uncharacterized protein RCC_01851 [Ramularia collo-cygni]CZT16011.1 uncharacterized protein RCC_01851 [Ramularia collo-cygni]